MNVLDAMHGWTMRDGPLYRRIAAAIEDAVRRGDLPPGTVLPAERQLAQMLVVGRSTVVGAYDLLRAAGVVESRQGSGTWVAGAERDPTSRRGRPESLGPAALTGSEDIIDLATASLPAAPAVRMAIEELPDSDLDDVLIRTGYSALGDPILRRVVADHFTADGLPTSSEQILVTSGEQQALALITDHLLTTSEVALVEDPTSPGLLDLLRGLPVAIRSAGSLAAVGAEALLGVMATANPALLSIQPVLGQEGRIADELGLLRLAAGLRSFVGTVVEDTGSRDLAEGPPPYLAAVARDTRVLTVGSVSKLFWGGLRVGWIRGDENVVARLSRLKARIDLGTSPVTQRLAVWLLHRREEVRVQRLADLRSRADHAVAALNERLPELTVEPHHGATTLWVRLPTGTARPFAELARRHGVAIVPGDALSPGGTGDMHVRIALGAAQTVFDAGVARLAQAWTEYRRSPTDDSLDHQVLT